MPQGKSKSEQFHPACILAVLSNMELPRGDIDDISELMTFLVNGKREKSNAESRAAKQAYFKQNIEPLIIRYRPALAKQFPELKKVSLLMTDQQVINLRKSDKNKQEWIKTIEYFFTPSIEVHSLNVNQSKDNPEVINQSSVDKNNPTYLVQYLPQNAAANDLKNKPPTNNAEQYKSQKAKL
ncbi:MAG: hypothetical protein JSS07_08275 [Proteobacteria bacterium]|nr:hypothetical protein [Pseudomonadota bacterium]